MWHRCIQSNGNGILGSGGTEAKFEVGGYAINEGDLMQFTGLKDKNGKEIFEGDILDSHFKIEWNMLHCGWALFNRKGFCHQLLADEYDANGDILHPWQINGEVIGNIYENPELL
jgi:hypothetical protein